MSVFIMGRKMTLDEVTFIQVKIDQLIQIIKTDEFNLNPEYCTPRIREFKDFIENTDEVTFCTLPALRTIWDVSDMLIKKTNNNNRDLDSSHYRLLERVVRSIRKNRKNAIHRLNDFADRFHDAIEKDGLYPLYIKESSLECGTKELEPRVNDIIMEDALFRYQKRGRWCKLVNNNVTEADNIKTTEIISKLRNVKFPVAKIDNQLTLSKDDIINELVAYVKLVVA